MRHRHHRAMTIEELASHMAAHHAAVTPSTPDRALGPLHRTDHEKGYAILERGTEDTRLMVRGAQ